MGKRICIDCQHLIVNKLGITVMSHVCAVAQETDLVTGNKTHRFCSVQRSVELPDYCGKEGKFWKQVTIPKEELDLAFPPLRVVE